jgi:proteasome lid subunit RPN8/RPN11
MLQRILVHAAAEPGREVCGLLLSSQDSVRTERDAWSTSFDCARDERVESVVETPNVAANPADSFEIDPAALFAALRTERAGGPRLIGHYHSHPNGSPTPSERDAVMANQPGRLWLIVAAGTARMWREVPGGAVHGAFDPAELVIGPPDEGCA